MEHAEAKSYGRALFRIAQEKDLLEVFKDDLGKVDSVIEQHPEIVDILREKKVDDKDAKELLTCSFDDIDPNVFNFLNLLYDKHKFQLIFEIKNCFDTEYRTYENIKVAQIYTVRELSDEQVEQIRVALSKRFRREMECHVQIDKSLIAGIKVQVGDEVLEYSIKNKIVNLPKRF